MPTLLVQPGTLDNWGQEASPTTNRGGNVVWQLAHDTGGGNRAREFFAFDASALPAGVVISAAVLEIYVHTYLSGGAAGQTTEVRRLTRTDWEEFTSSWDNYKTGPPISPWTSAGGDSSATDIATALTPAVNNWMVFDVLAQMQYAQINTSNILHGLMRWQTETGASNRVLYAHSNNYGTASLTPKLTITYNFPAGYSTWMSTILDD